MTSIAYVEYMREGFTRHIPLVAPQPPLTTNIPPHSLISLYLLIALLSSVFHSASLFFYRIPKPENPAKMQITLPIPTALLLLSLPFQTFSTPTPEIQATSNGPLTIPPLSLGAATVNIGGTSRIYWQALDGGVHEALGNGSPGPGRTYVDQILIPSGKARIGTPLSIVDGTNGLIIVTAPPPLFMTLLFPPPPFQPPFNLLERPN